MKRRTLTIILVLLLAAVAGVCLGDGAPKERDDLITVTVFRGSIKRLRRSSGSGSSLSS